MFSLVRITATVATVALGTGLVLSLARPVGVTGPGGFPAADLASPGAPMDAVRVTATQTCSWYTVDGVATATCTHDASDPRVTGQLTMTPVGSVGGVVDENDLEVYDVRLEGPEGAWTGRVMALFDQGADPLAAYAIAVLVGDGAYEGWTYVDGGPDIPPDGSMGLVGVLYQGAPPASGAALTASQQ